MRFSSSIKDLVHRIHQILSHSKFATYLYINSLSLLVKPLPCQSLKQRIINSINCIKWREMDLPPQNIILGTSTDVRVIPHWYEYDFESILNTKLKYEQEVFTYLESNMANYDLIIEIGANIGFYSIFFAKNFLRQGKSANKIFVFEPSREAYLRLSKNIELNSINDIQSYNCAIGNQTGFLNFYEPDSHLTNGSLKQEFAEEFSSFVHISRTLCIESIMLEHLIPAGAHVLIKIDVEGSEYEVLQGLAGMVERKKPTFLIEVLPEYQNQLNKVDFLHNGSYELFNITKEGLVKFDCLKATTNRDYLASPLTRIDRK